MASVFGLRSRNLKTGIRNLLGDTYAGEVFRHPLIKHLARQDKNPSYIRPSIFATALVDVVGRRDDGEDATPLSSDQVHAALDKMDGKEPVRGVLLALSRGGNESLDEMRDAVADWYDEAMDRVAGWYKRRVKWILLIIAGFVTVAVNADTIRIAEQLWYDDELRAAAVEAAEPYMRAAAREDQAALDAAGSNGGDSDVSRFERTLETLRGDLGTFPIGYPDGFNLCCIRLSMIVGWLLTIGAISLGAPFWFDLLGKVSHLRGSGTKEADRAKKPGPAPPAAPAAPKGKEALRR